MDKYQKLKILQDDVIELICDFCDNVDKREIQGYLMSIAFRIWSGNKQYSDSYREAINLLSGNMYTTEQIMTAFACAGEEIRNLKVPDFAMSINDSQKKEIINNIGKFAVEAALINGDFTMEEAARWNSIMKALAKKWLDDEYYIDRMDVSAEDYITGINEESYLKPVTDKDERKAETAFGGVSQTVQPPKDLTISLNLDPEVKNLLQNQKTSDEVKPKVVEANNKTLVELLEELDSLVGLKKVKKDVHSLLNFLKVSNLRKQKGMKVPTISYHLVFTGNPGTGKTTVARLIAQLYYKMGLLSKGQMIETDRSSLVAGYLGQTAIKTQKVIQEALGGVLFIDEAYALAEDDDDSYGKEAIETLLKGMEDNRDDLVVIVAGYDELMRKFIDSNPGLRSRFNKFFQFPDYDGDELLKIFKRFCSTNGYEIDEQVAASLGKCFWNVFNNREEHFGNARTVRNVFETAICCQADRIAEYPVPTESDLMMLTMEDVSLALEEEFGC